MDLAELLGYYNLTRQESALYLLLCSEGKLTGYEAAKASGISRSNTYTALAGLVEKGAAYVEEDTATHYLPVPVEEFCDNRIRRMQEYRELLLKAAPKQREASEGYITIKGESNIFDKMKNMIDAAKERIYLSVSEQMLLVLLPQIQSALMRGLKVVIITDPPFVLEGALVYHTKTEQHQIRLIADSKNVLTGDIAAGSESTCLYSQKRNLIELFKEALKNEITLITVTKGS
nr:helix-turn-helix domain-containing protein [uncultured Caproiciproducens sp.]